MTAGTAGGERATIGIFGGTFNPVHLGHLRAAEEVVEILDLERMLFVPSADPPHKRPAEERIAPARLRYAWVEAAIRDNERFAVDPIELERPGRSYSVDTLEALGSRLGKRPVFVIGDEAFSELASWREPERLLTLAHFAVVSRPGAHGRDCTGGVEACLPETLARHFTLEPGGLVAQHRSAGTWVRSVPIDALEISSTDIRARLREGRSVRYLVPGSVERAIVESGVYVTGEAS